MPITVRPRQDGDAGTLALIFYRAVRIGAAAVYTEAQRADWAPEVWEAGSYGRHLDTFDTWVAEVDGQVQGFLSLEDGHHVELLFVAPEVIGRGLAFALYRRLLEEVRRPCRLTVEASLQSEAFFARQGWHATGTRIRGTRAARVVNRLMALDLAAE